MLFIARKSWGAVMGVAAQGLSCGMGVPPRIHLLREKELSPQAGGFGGCIKPPAQDSGWTLRRDVGHMYVPETL